MSGKPCVSNVAEDLPHSVSLPVLFAKPVSAQSLLCFGRAAQAVCHFSEPGWSCGQSCPNRLLEQWVSEAKIEI